MSALARQAASFDDATFQHAIALVAASGTKTAAAGAALLLDECHAGSDQFRDAIVLALFAELRLLRKRLATAQTPIVALPGALERRASA